MRHWTALLAAALGLACTSVTVRPLDPALHIQHVCIEENPKVWVEDFLPVLQEGFARHGISSQVFSGEAPAACEFVVTYTAFQNWDMAVYLTDAEIWLRRRGQQIAYARYHLKGQGGLALTKWQGTRTKMDPVIDELLSGYVFGTPKSQGSGS